MTLQHSILIDKLLLLAHGNLDLVDKAIRSVAVHDVADLSDVVDYIVAARRGVA